jgi:hypothetical protein
MSSRFDLSSLAGGSVRFRFAIGTDDSVRTLGWVVDDVQIYTCSAPPQPTLSIGDVSLSEGNSGTKTATFTVTKSGSTAQTVTANYATANGTATVLDNDYETASGPLSFGPTETTKSVSVTVNGDTKIEPTETFNVTLSNAVNATINKATGVGTITNDDVAREITVGDVSDEEGDALRFTISATNPQMGDVTLTYATENGTALAGSDYTATPPTQITIPGGTTSVPVDVLTSEDGSAEPDETLKLKLSAASGNGLITDNEAIGTITDDDARSLSVSPVTVTEGQTATFTVSATNPQRGPVTFDVETVTGSATASDFTELAKTSKTIDADDPSIEVAVATADDSLDESAESFKLKLSNPSENGLIGVSEATATITDNDDPPVVREVSINNKSVDEGDDAVFTITATHPEAGPVTVDVKTSEGSADDDVDYEGLDSTQITILGDSTTKTIVVDTIQDSREENNETFNVDLSNASGNAFIDDAQGLGTIRDDDGDDEDDGGHDDDEEPTPTPSVTPTPVPTGIPGATLDFSPAPLIPGKSATVSATGLPKDTLVDLYIFSEPILLGTVRTTSAGTFTINVDIPLLAAGSHTLVVTRANTTSTVASAPATLAQISTATTAPGSTPAPTARVLAAEETPVPASRLPDTGANIRTMVMFALFVIALGISSVGAERWVRKRRAG